MSFFVVVYVYFVSLYNAHMTFEIIKIILMFFKGCSGPRFFSATSLVIKERNPLGMFLAIKVHGKGEDAKMNSSNK